MTRDEVISAFVDNEMFDPRALREALDDPAGRELLLDLVALRQLIEPEIVAGTDVSVPARRQRPALWWSAAAAVVILALGGGYVAGRRTETAVVAAGATRTAPLQAVGTDSAPPRPTVVVRLGSDAAWQPVPKGASR